MIKGVGLNVYDSKTQDVDPSARIIVEVEG